jgi:hypothetical protein
MADMSLLCLSAAGDAALAGKRTILSRRLRIVARHESIIIVHHV